MPINELIRHLRVLDAQTSWRKSQLPKEITPDVLNQLDVAGLIGVKLWGRHTIGGGKSDRPVPLHWYGRCGWFVASDHWGIAGTLDQILAHPEYQGEYEPEFRVSPTGAEWLLRERGDKPEAGGGVELLPAPVDKATLAKAILFENPDISPTELARRVGVSRGTLYSRSPKWKHVRQTLLARDRARIPKGTKNADGNIEADAEGRELHPTRTDRDGD